MMQYFVAGLATVLVMMFAYHMFPFLLTTAFSLGGINVWWGFIVGVIIFWIFTKG